MTNAADSTWLEAIAIVANARSKCVPGERFEALNLVLGDMETARREAMRRDQRVAPLVAQPEVHEGAEALIDLIGDLGREVYYLLDDCETSGPVGEEIHTVTSEALEKVADILDRIDALPFEVPGVILGTSAMLQEAIKQTFLTPAPAAQVGEVKALIVGGSNRGQVVDLSDGGADHPDCIQILFGGQVTSFVVDEDVPNPQDFIISELRRAYEFVTKGERAAGSGKL